MKRLWKCNNCDYSVEISYDEIVRIGCTPQCPNEDCDGYADLRLVPEEDGGIDKVVSKMCNIMFSTDGEGHWIKREWAEQCPEIVLMAKRCQGVKGHKDVHWSYQPSGCLAWDDNEDDPKHDGCSGSTPPDHEKYITPLEMSDKLWLNNFTDTEVTDPEEITRLERDEINDNESINRPCSLTKEEIHKLREN